jgi:hypothetical protein
MARGGWQLPVPLGVLVLKLWQRWEVEVGVSLDEEWFWVGGEAVLGF